MNPKEFCDRWLPSLRAINPGDWGYYKAACELIAAITGYSIETVKNWGPDFVKSPEPAKRCLGLQHQLLIVHEHSKPGNLLP